MIVLRHGYLLKFIDKANRAAEGLSVGRNDWRRAATLDGVRLLQDTLVSVRGLGERFAGIPGQTYNFGQLLAEFSPVDDVTAMQEMRSRIIEQIETCAYVGQEEGNSGLRAKDEGWTLTMILNGYDFALGAVGATRFFEDEQGSHLSVYSKGFTPEDMAAGIAKQPLQEQFTLHI